jgi:nucleoside-diphosphate-sugar epimerase
MANAVFGATGRTGSFVLQPARRRGWPVRALARRRAGLAEAPGTAGCVDLAKTLCGLLTARAAPGRRVGIASRRGAAA